MNLAHPSFMPFALRAWRSKWSHTRTVPFSAKIKAWIGRRHIWSEVGGGGYCITGQVPNLLPRLDLCGVIYQFRQIFTYRWSPLTNSGLMSKVGIKIQSIENSSQNRTRPDTENLIILSISSAFNLYQILRFFNLVSGRVLALIYATTAK